MKAHVANDVPVNAPSDKIVCVLFCRQVSPMSLL